jgi:hypothetical protein
VSSDGVTRSQLLYTGTGSTASGIWEAGIACANSAGAVVDNWNVQVTFSAKSTDPNGFTWTAVPQLHVVTTVLPSATATIGTAYNSGAITAAGGTAPYKWKLTSGPLPKGLKLNAGTGVISGTVAASTKAPKPGPYPITVTVTDHSKGTKETATASFILTLAP